MNNPFDYDAFIKHFATILVGFDHKSFVQLTEEAESVRQHYKGIRERRARKYINRYFAYWILTFAMNSSQPQKIVDRLHRRVMKLGFNDPHAVVAISTGYAAYCTDSGQPEKGLHGLQEAREVICLNEGILPGKMKNFLRPIDSMIRRLEKNGRL